MIIEVKKIKLTKSKIQQMNYIAIPKNLDVEILGWVNMDKKRWVIVKSIDNYYRAEFITNIKKELKPTQFVSNPGLGYIFPELHHIECQTYNKRSFSYSPEEDDSKNLKFYQDLVSFKRKTEIAGQIYY